MSGARPRRSSGSWSGTSTGDWGEVDTEDQTANDYAVIFGERVLSAYRLPDGTKVWVFLVTATYSGLPYGGIR